MNRILFQILLDVFCISLLLIFENVHCGEYFLDTCCSLNENETIFLSCSSNEIVHLNLIEIYYNSNDYCSYPSSCCQIQTSCSRRITKYSSFNCDGKQFCFISKRCFPIYSSCTNYQSRYGQYITIQYSCLNIHNQTDSQEEEDQTVLVHLSASDQKMKENFLWRKQLKSSPIFLIAIIFLFLCFLLIIYWLADFIGKKYCQQKSSHFQSNLIYLNKPNEKHYVQSNSSIPIRKIYPQFHSLYPYQTLINVQHDPFTGQVYSRTFYPHFNSYQ